MGTVDGFAEAFAWYRTLRRLQEEHPEACEAFDVLAEEFGHREAVRRAMKTTEGRALLVEIGEALIEIQGELGGELRGDPAPAKLVREPILEPLEAGPEEEPEEPEAKSESPAERDRLVRERINRKHGGAGGQDRGQGQEPPPPAGGSPLGPGAPDLGPLRRQGGWRSL